MEPLRLIPEIVTGRRRRYGSPRVREEPRRKYGKRVSLKKAAVLMRENGLNARKKRSFVRTARPDHGLPAGENLLNREFRAGKGGQKWVSGITCLRTSGDWAYLATVLDLADRRIAGGALSTDLEAAHTTVPALEMAFKNRRAREGLLFHSGRGARYCAKAFRDRLKALCPSVRQGMSRNGNCGDNAGAESFFKTLKRELETLDGNHSQAAVWQSVFMYIEAYYNRVRLHSGLDYSAPDWFNLEQAA